jgi:hypothetical protein
MGGWLSSVLGTTSPAITNAAFANMNQTRALAGQYGQAAGDISARMMPTLNRWATGGAPGYGPMNLSQMQTRAQLSGGATAGRAAEDARLRAMRSGNFAGVNALTGAGTEGAARGVGSTVQDILAQNAELQSKQQQSAMGELGNLYGEDVNAEMRAQQLVPGAIAQARQMQSPGILPEITMAANDLSQLGADAMGFMSPVKKMGGWLRGGGGGGGGMDPYQWSGSEGG